MNKSSIILLLITLAIAGIQGCIRTNHYDEKESDLCPYQQCKYDNQCSSGDCINASILDDRLILGYCRLETWQIVLIALGSLLVFVGIVILIVCCCRKRRKFIRHSLHTYHNDYDKVPKSQH